MIKTLQTQNGRRLCQPDKEYLQKSITNKINGEKLYIFPLKWETRQGCPLSLLLFSVKLDILDNPGRPKNKKVIIGIQIEKEEIKPSLCTDDMTMQKIPKNA